MEQLILGSQSPRRKEILGYFSLPFKQVSPDFVEEEVVFRGDPVAYVCDISSGKALSLISAYPNAPILTADTTVYKEGNIYGKPKDIDEAFAVLTDLQGSWHSVFTGVSVAYQGKVWSRYEETRVLFNSLTPEEIRRYHKQFHWADKAGGYAVQMPGGLAIARIDGCYYNVMGLPINSVRFLLQNIGIELWNFIK